MAAQGPSQSQQHQLMLQQRPQTQSRFGMRSTPGEIVEVQGGHIVRSTGRKDRHSKVCTAKGPRDRRVRLSAHTAIQFYDVQDRLGYDRPSKAVDWLMKNAKAAIDELAELPAWHPTATSSPNPAPAALLSSSHPHGESEHGCSSSRYSFASAAATAAGSSSSFLPPSLDSDAIADTIKSFFPMAAAAAAAPAPTAPTDTSPIGFQNYPPDLLSRTSCQNQDLRLSLQSFTDPIFHHHQQQHNHQQQQQNPNATSHHVFFSGFDAASAGMIPWNVAEASEAGGGGGGGYVFNMPLQQQQQQQAVQAMQHTMLGQVPGQFFTQRGPLQSSNPPFVRASWMDPMAAAAAAAAADHPMHSVIHHPSFPSIGFASGSSGGFSGFHIPARIQGEEEHDGLSSDRPSSASSGSHH